MEPNKNTVSVDRNPRYRRIATSVPVNNKRLNKISKIRDERKELEQMPKGTLMNLRDQLKRLNLRTDADNKDQFNKTGHFYLISQAHKDKIEAGIFGFKLNLSDVNQKVDKGRITMKGSEKHKFFNFRKRQHMIDPEQKFHENMVAYKNSLPPFFKSSKFVLINKDGELLQEETEALRAQLSPNNNHYPETEVPFSHNDDESYYDGQTQNERLVQLVPKKFKENLVYKYKDKHTNERMKSVRALKKMSIPVYDIKSETDNDLINKFKKTGNFELLSPGVYDRTGNDFKKIGNSKTGIFAELYHK